MNDGLAVACQMAEANKRVNIFSPETRKNPNNFQCSWNWMKLCENIFQNGISFDWISNQN